jgi:hypothetical protein
VETVGAVVGWTGGAGFEATGAAGVVFAVAVPGATIGSAAGAADALGAAGVSTAAATGGTTVATGAGGAAF